MTIQRNNLLTQLIRRGYSVDIGIVQRHDFSSGKHTIRQYEIDFVINRGPKQIYIQSVFSSRSKLAGNAVNVAN
jgi:hypothetical protein